MGKEEQGTSKSLVLVATDLIDGMEIGYGMKVQTDKYSTSQEDDHSTA